MGVIEFLFALAQDMILAAIPAVGFAMVFNVPVRALRWCALLGSIGHGSRMILMTSGLNIEWSTFMASMLVGTIGIQWSGIWHIRKCLPWRPLSLCSRAYRLIPQ